MKGRAILLQRREDGAEAAALLEGGRLEDLLLSAPDDAGWGAEAIVAGRVDRLLKGAEGGRGAAFLDLGEAGERGYLPGAGATAEGSALLAEIRAWPGGEKAWPLTEGAALRSRRLALTPAAPGLNISRSIKDDTARAEIRAALEGALGAAGVGCVARSAAGAERDGLEAEAAWLLAQWTALTSAEGVGLRRAAPGPIALALREWTARREAEILSACPDISAAIDSAIAPGDPIRARIGEGGADLFERLDVWGRAEALFASRQALASGGALTLEETAALVAADVDSGAGAPGAADAEAADALPRLLRLRGLGGLVAVDFLARAPGDRKRLEAMLGRAFARDPVETEILGWTQGGLLELRRKRARRRLTRADLAVWVAN